MVVLGVVILSLACAFMGYCLLHFEQELARSRSRATCYGLSLPNVRGGASQPEAHATVVALRTTRVAAVRRLDSKLGRPDRSEYTSTILTFGKSRLTVLPSRTARVAEKRAVKG